MKFSKIGKFTRKKNRLTNLNHKFMRKKTPLTIMFFVVTFQGWINLITAQTPPLTVPAVENLIKLYFAIGCRNKETLYPYDTKFVSLLCIRNYNTTDICKDVVSYIYGRCLHSLEILYICFVFFLVNFTT